MGFGFSLKGELDVAWLAKLGSLFVLPFAHEDFAILAGAYLVVNELMPATLVALAIYAGIVVSDLALYGVGVGARRLPWLGRYAVDARVESLAIAAGRNVFGVTAICRMVPGMAFVALVACGWMRVSFGRFVAASMIVSALYLPIVLYLVIVFGQDMSHRVGPWSWPLLLVALIAAGYARQSVLTFRKPGDIESPAAIAIHAGRGALHRGRA